MEINSAFLHYFVIAPALVPKTRPSFYRRRFVAYHGSNFRKGTSSLLVGPSIAQGTDFGRRRCLLQNLNSTKYRWKVLDSGTSKATDSNHMPNWGTNNAFIQTLARSFQNHQTRENCRCFEQSAISKREHQATNRHNF